MAWNYIQGNGVTPIAQFNSSSALGRNTIQPDPNVETNTEINPQQRQLLTNIQNPLVSQLLGLSQPEEQTALARSNVQDSDPYAYILQNSSTPETSNTQNTSLRDDGSYRYNPLGNQSSYIPSALNRNQSNNPIIDQARAVQDSQIKGRSLNKNQQQMQDMLVNAFVKNGLTKNQAIAVVAEIGRENDYQENLIFGNHADPARGHNLGFLSWQGSRRAGLEKFLKSRGLMTDNGTIVKSPAALEAQAEYAVHEMKTTYRNKLNYFWEHPNANPNEFAREVGKNYIGWAYGQNTISKSDGSKVPFNWTAHNAKRASFANAMVNKYSNQG